MRISNGEGTIIITYGEGGEVTSVKVLPKEYDHVESKAPITVEPGSKLHDVATQLRDELVHVAAT